MLESRPAASAASNTDDTSTFHNNEVKEPGLFISDRDIRLMKRFVSEALSLPIDIAQIQHIIGATRTDIVGLEPEDIRQLYQNIRAAAGDWPQLESEMKSVATGLVSFSDTLKDTVETLVGFIDDLPGYQSALGRVDNVSEDQLSDSKMSELLTKLEKTRIEQDARSKLPVLVALTADLSDMIGSRRGTTETLGKRLSEFESGLKTLEPELALKRKLCESYTGNEAIIEFNRKIDSINKSIDEKSRAFATRQKYNFLLTSTTNFGAIQNGINFISESKEHRAEIENSLNTKKQLEKEIRLTNNLIASLSTLETDLQSLKIRLADAVQTASYLESHWGVTLQFISDSQDRLQKTENIKLLYILSSRLKSSIRSWTVIKHQSLKLLDALSANPD